MIALLSRLWNGAVFRPDPDREPVNGQEAWALFQEQAAALKERARKDHGAVRPIEKKQQDIVHSALSRSIPSRGVGA